MTSVTLILAPPVSILLNMIDVWMTIDRHNILNSINKRQERHNIFHTFFFKVATVFSFIVYQNVNCRGAYSTNQKYKSPLA